MILKIVFNCILLYLTVLSVMQATVIGSSVVVVVETVVVSVSLLVVSNTFPVVSFLPLVKVEIVIHMNMYCICMFKVDCIQVAM